MLTDKIKQNEKPKRSVAKDLLKLGLATLALYGVLKIPHPLDRKTETWHLKDLYTLTHIQRNGARVYKSEDWVPIDQNTKKKITYRYIDSDNNGAPETGYVCFPDGSMGLYKYSNKITITDLIKPTNSKYLINGRIIEER